MTGRGDYSIRGYIDKAEARVLLFPSLLVIPPLPGNEEYVNIKKISVF